MNSTDLAAFEQSAGAGLVHSYPETRIGAFDFYVGTCTEPLWCGNADGQRACGDSWPEVTEDLFLFSQEDPIPPQPLVMSGYTSANNSPLHFIDPLGWTGVGVVGGGEVSVGIVYGGGVQAGAGVGVFTGGPQGVNVGGFVAGGAGVGGPSAAATLPSSGTSEIGTGKVFFLGAYAGLGYGPFVTNAKCVKDLEGQFSNVGLNLPPVLLPNGVALPSFSLNVSWGGGIWYVSLTQGPGGVFSVTGFPTFTRGGTVWAQRPTGAK